MATIQSTIELNDRFSATLNKLDSGLSKSTSVFSKFKAGLTGGNMPKFGSSISSGLDAVNAKVNKTGSLFKTMLGANIIGSGITSGLAAIKNGVSSMIGDLSEASAVWKTFEGNMSNLGKSSSQIAAIKGDLQDFAQATIYSASDMSSTYSQLAAVGTKNTTQLVKGFGGLASAASDPTQAMKTLSQQATQMAAKPKVQWQDFKLMLEQSPAGIAAVAKTMGVSTGTMIKNIQAGKVATSDFFAAVAKTGTNANFTKMATQFKTVGQAADGLRETVTNKLQSAFDSASQVGIDFLSNLSDKINSIDFNAIADNLMGTLSRIGAVFAAFWTSFADTPAITMLKTAFEGIMMAISHVVKALLGIKEGASGLDSVRSAGEMIGKVIGTAATKIDEFAGYISSIDPSTIRTVAKTILGIVVAIKVATAAFKVFKTAMAVAGVVQGIAGAIAAVAGSSAAAAVSTPAAAAGTAAMGTAGSTAAPSLLEVGGALLMIGGAVLLAAAGMFILVQSAVQLAAAGWPAVAALVGLVAVIGAFMAATIILGPALAAGAAGMIMFGVALALVAVSVLIAAAGLALIAVVMPLIATYGTQAATGFLLLGLALLVFGPAAIIAGAGAIVLGAGLLVLAVAVTVAAVGITLLAVGMTLLGASLLIVDAGIMILAVFLPIVAMYTLVAATGFMMLSVSMIMFAPLALIASVAVAVLAAGLLLFGVAAVVGGAGAIVLAAGLMAVSVAMMLVAAGVAVTAAALRGLGTAVLSLATAFVTAGSRLVSAITSAMSRVVSAVRSGIQSAVSAARGFAGSLVSVGRDLIMGLVHGITSMIGSAVSAVGRVASSVVAKAKSLLHIGSPSRLFKKFGRWTIEGYNIGVSDRGSAAVNTMGGVMSEVIGAGSGLSLDPIDMSNLIATNPGDLLANGFARAANAVGQVAGALKGLPTNSNIGINGDVSGQLNSDQKTPTSTITGLNDSGTTATTNNNSNRQTVVQSGAIQINGATADDGEAIATKLEIYLRQRENADLG